MDEREPSAFPSDEEYRSAMERVRESATDPQVLAILALFERALRHERVAGIPVGERLAEGLVAPRPALAKRTALISDIHGNLAGLNAVLADIAACNCDRILCLGDLVDGGPADEAVVALLRAQGVPAVRGNHDEHNDASLERATQEFLSRLPEAIVEDGVHFTHISPRRTKRKLNHAVEAWNVFEDCDFRVLFVGHSHVPLHFSSRGAVYGEAAALPVTYNQAVAFDREQRHIVCVGSVGYGRDDVGKLRYAIFDREAWTVEFRAVDGPLLPHDYALRVRFDGPLGLAPRDGVAG